MPRTTMAYPFQAHCPVGRCHVGELSRQHAHAQMLGKRVRTRQMCCTSLSYRHCWSAPGSATRSSWNTRFSLDENISAKRPSLQTRITLFGDGRPGGGSQLPPPKRCKWARLAGPGTRSADAQSTKCPDMASRVDHAHAKTVEYTNFW